MQISIFSFLYRKLKLILKINGFTIESGIWYNLIFFLSLIVTGPILTRFGFKLYQICFLQLFLLFLKIQKAVVT